MLENYIKQAETNSNPSFYEEVGKLPSELAEKWIDEYEGLDDPLDPDFFYRFNNFVIERERIMAGSLEFAPGTPSEVLEEIRSLKEKIINEYGNPESFLGEGRTAKVHVHPESPSICIKYIKDVESYTKTDIPLYEEYIRLLDLQNLIFAGVRTPTPYFENTSGIHMYGMERIKGNTLFQILEKPEQNRDLIELAKTLDRELVLENILNFVNIMHEKYKITHNDLEIINIMLGVDGNFYIIDFGKSKLEEIGEDHELYRGNDVRMTKSSMKEFFRKIDNIDIN